MEQLVAGGEIEIAAEDYGNIRRNFFHFAGEPFELFALIFSIFGLFPPASRRPQVGADAVRVQTDAEDLDDKSGWQLDSRVAEWRVLGVAGGNWRELSAGGEGDIIANEDFCVRAENGGCQAFDGRTRWRFLEQHNIGVIIRHFSRSLFVAGGAIQ